MTSRKPVFAFVLLSTCSLARAQIYIPTIVNVLTDPSGACASPGPPLQYNTQLNHLSACQGASPGPYSWALANLTGNLSTTGTVTTGVNSGLSGSLEEVSNNTGTPGGYWNVSNSMVSGVTMNLPLNRVGEVDSPTVLAYSADLTAQTAAISAASFYTPPAAGEYRICYTGKITTVASTGSATSNLGGTTGFSIAYTGGTDSVSLSPTLEGFNQSGGLVTVGTGLTTNTTATTIHGCGEFYMGASAVTYSFGYASNTASQMQYELHIRAEAIQQ